MERTYFAINEEMARQAKTMISFDDYKEGSKTAEYRVYADKAYDLAERIEQERPMEAERAWRIAKTYARRMADNMNRQSRIDCMCPSIMIAGGSNFPVRKKQKQIAAMDNAMREWNEINGYIEKLKSILRGKNIIKADDEDAIMRLEEKLSEREALQETMKEVNAYYRKNRTLDGCAELPPQTIEEIKSAMASSWRQDPKPFESFYLTNNNAEIRRIKKRLESLRAIKSQESAEERHDSLNLTVKRDTIKVRIQIFFDEKPDEDTRAVVKSNGFRWAPSVGAWQRQLNGNGEYALKRILEELGQG